MAYHLPKSLVSTVMKMLVLSSPSYTIRQNTYRYSALVSIIPVYTVYLVEELLLLVCVVSCASFRFYLLTILFVVLAFYRS